MAALQESLRLKADDADTHLLLGMALLGMGQKNQAQRVYRTLLTLDRQKAQQLYAEINKMK